MKILRNLVAVFFMAPALLMAHPAEDLIYQITSDVMAALENPKAKTDSKFVRDVLDKDVLPHIDFTTMTKITLGASAWKQATKEQHTQLVAEFRDLLINTYTAALDQYSGQQLEILPHKAAKNDDKIAQVNTIFTDASVKFPVDYKLRTSRSNKKVWQVYDIEVEGVSLVKSYKAEFNSEISKSGVDGLIKTLRSKNEGS